MTGCGKNGPSAAASGMYFDTFVTITGYDDTDTAVFEEAIDECAKYELIFSKTNTESELYKINDRQNCLSDDEIEKLIQSKDYQQGIYMTYISEDMYNVIYNALEYTKGTNNAYNVAIGAVTDLWDYHSESPTVPNDDVIKDMLSHTDIETVRLYSFDTEGKYAISIDDTELKLDLGGIAKGYIANKIRDFLIEKGCGEAVIALGGNIYCLGDKAGAGYKVGVQRPFANRGESSLSIQASNTSVVTSGIYERHFEVDGHMYHHIISSVTGYPVDNSIYGVTVICEDSLRADVLSTALLCMGEEAALQYIEQQSDIKVIINLQDGSIMEKGF